MTEYLAMTTFAFVTSISPGPVNIIATAAGANSGYTRTVPHILGATFGFVVILFILGLGLAKLIYSVPYLTEIITYVGGVFLLYMSYKIASARIAKGNNHKVETDAPSFIQGMLCQWLNPKAWIVSLAGISLFLNSEVNTQTLLLFCGIFFIICYVSISVWAILGVSIRALLAVPRHYKLFNLCMGLLLAITVVYTFFMAS